MREIQARKVLKSVACASGESDSESMAGVSSVSDGSDEDCFQIALTDISWRGCNMSDTDLVNRCAKELANVGKQAPNPKPQTLNAPCLPLQTSSPRNRPRGIDLTKRLLRLSLSAAAVRCLDLSGNELEGPSLEQVLFRCAPQPFRKFTRQLIPF